MGIGIRIRHRWRDWLDSVGTLRCAVGFPNQRRAKMRDRSLKSSQPGLLRGMAMDCQLDGLLSETGPHGFRIDFGRIISWTPPSSLEFLCQVPAHRAPRPDPEQAIMVSVVFDSLADGTRVTVKHHAWERHGAEAQKYRDGFAEAWPMARERFSRHLERWAEEGAPRLRHPALGADAMGQRARDSQKLMRCLGAVT